jgi:predicted DNA-binding transcriptional regulator AlpA
MPRNVDPDDLVGSREIAARLGIAQSTVVQWRKRYSGFPEPVAKLHQTLVWSWADIEEWTRKNRKPR